MKETINMNKYKISVKSMEDSSITDKYSFFKYSPLMDPIKYMTGKYKNTKKNYWFLSNFKASSKKSLDKMKDRNNSAYVDAFFLFCLVDYYTTINLFMD